MKTKQSIKLLLAIQLLVTLFHLTIILKIIPYENVWGGRLENDDQMYVFEILSVIVNLYLILIVSQKGNLLKKVFSEKVVKISLWAFMILFGLNTIGNLLAQTTFEKFFAIITLVSSILLWNILKQSKRLKSHE
ncbi:hypothetical protein [Marivirga arenosa]|uniref:Uncharacterized protein n=1 Tax=Marivirga arenosa TaxID=3059076 RepID=A0AA49JCV8_9BACT|nr:hypothetical protein [Marivirga sp. BKB1-2]WKK80719.2 hypothetical protein QYS47_27110 [Marivirga sp. BKB1-2]